MQYKLARLAGLIVLLSLVFLTADAARKTPSCRLTAQSTSSGAHTATCDIPSGTTTALIGFVFDNVSAGQVPTSVSLDGQTATLKIKDDGGPIMTAIFAVTGFSTGSGKTLAWTNPSAMLGINIPAEYRDGTLTYGATDSDNCTGCGTLTSNSLANSNNDEMLCVYGNDNSSISGVGSGQTQLDDSLGAAGEYGFTTKTTTGSSTTSSFTFASGSAGYSCVMITTTVIVPPTFTANPAIGTRTTSSIPITATSACTDCTFYGVAYTDGLADPSCTQIKAAHDVNGAAAYKSFSEAMTATVQATGTFGTYTDGTKRDSAYCMNSTANGDSAVFALADIDKIPVSSCTFNSTATQGVTYDCTLDGPGTVYGVACIYNSTNATVAQVTAGQCTGNATAKASANRSGTGSLTVGGSLPNPIYDFSFVGAYNFGSQVETATHKDLARCVAPAPGKQVINCPNGLTSIASGSAVEALNVLVTPDWAVGDIPVCDATTTPGGYGPIPPATTLMSATGLVSYSAGGDTSRQYVNCDVYDVSANAMATVADANNDLDWYNNDPAIVCSSPFSPFNVVLKTNVAMNASPNPGNIDFTTKCTHPLGDTLTFALTSGTLPADLTLSSPTLSGTPTVENESGASLVVTATSNVTGGTGTQPLVIYPFTTLTLPDCTTSLTLQSACTNTILATFKNAILVNATFVNDNTISVGNVISQDPVAGAEVAPYDTVSLVVSLGSTVTTVIVPKCVGEIFSACVDDVARSSSFATVSSACAANDEVYSQAPAVGRSAPDTYVLTALCR